MDDRDLVERLRRIGSGAAPAEPAYERLLDRRDRRRRSSRIASAVMAFTVLAAGIAVAAVAFAGHRQGVHRGPGFAAGGPGGSKLVAGPGRYYYWKTERVMQGPNVIEEMWWGDDGSGRYLVDQSNPDYGVLTGDTWKPDAFPGVFPFETDLSGLSTDPDVIGGQLVDRSAPNGASPRPEVTIAPGVSLESSKLWSAGTQILQMGNATPRLRVAVYDVLRQIPEVSEGAGKDPAGRDAVTLTMDVGQYYGGGVETLYFDPDTHLLLAMQGGQDGTVIVLAGGIADSRNDTPAAGEAFFPSAAP